jgi:hypothetical protein
MRSFMLVVGFSTPLHIYICVIEFHSPSKGLSILLKNLIIRVKNGWRLITEYFEYEVFKRSWFKYFVSRIWNAKSLKQNWHSKSRVWVAEIYVQLHWRRLHDEDVFEHVVILIVIYLFGPQILKYSYWIIVDIKKIRKTSDNTWPEP